MKIYTKLEDGLFILGATGERIDLTGSSKNAPKEIKDDWAQRLLDSMPESVFKVEPIQADIPVFTPSAVKTPNITFVKEIKELQEQEEVAEDIPKTPKFKEEDLEKMKYNDLKSLAAKEKLKFDKTPTKAILIESLLEIQE